MLGQRDRAAELFAILNPIHHGSRPDDVARHQVEPYAACADVYSVPPHVGRGGWTWYTGSARSLYRAGLEAILGFRVHANHADDRSLSAESVDALQTRLSTPGPAGA